MGTTDNNVTAQRVQDCLTTYSMQKNNGEQTVDHIIYSCDLHEKERDKLVAVITRTEQWPVSKSKMMLKYYKDFKQFTDSMVLNEG